LTKKQAARARLAIGKWIWAICENGVADILLWNEYLPLTLVARLGSQA
jgi:hypothetical protein